MNSAAAKKGASRGAETVAQDGDPRTPTYTVGGFIHILLVPAVIVDPVPSRAITEPMPSQMNATASSRLKTMFEWPCGSSSALCRWLSPRRVATPTDQDQQGTDNLESPSSVAELGGGR